MGFNITDDGVVNDTVLDATQSKLVLSFLFVLRSSLSQSLCH